MHVPDVERYLRLAEHDFEVLRILARAAATDPRPRDVSDWKVTILYYVACILVRALGKDRGKDFGDHFMVKQWMNTTHDLLPMTRPYRKLEERSRDARYEGRLFSDAQLEQSVAWFIAVRDHVLDLLGRSATYRFPRLDPDSALRP